MERAAHTSPQPQHRPETTWRLQSLAGRCGKMSLRQDLVMQLQLSCCCCCCSCCLHYCPYEYVQPPQDEGLQGHVLLSLHSLQCVCCYCCWRWDQSLCLWHRCHRRCCC